MTRHLGLTLLLGATLTLPLAALPADADAAGYDVHVCESSWSPPTNRAFVGFADPGMTAYADCPAGDGLVVRNAYDGGTTPSGAGAYVTFEAPIGTTVGSIDFNAGIERHECGYSALIVAASRTSAGTPVWGTQAGDNCSGWPPTGPGVFMTQRFGVAINADRVRAQVRCASGTTCSRNGVSVLRLRDIVVHVRDDTAPALSGGRGPLWTSDGRWLAGAQAIGFDAADGSGIRELSFLIDGKEVTHQSRSCDFTLPAPCPGTSSLEGVLPTAAFGADGEHQLTLTATDAAGTTATAAKTIRVDNTAPDPPTGVTLAGGDAWRKANAFDVTWTNPATTAAPIAGAYWELCPEGRSDGCKTGSKDGEVARLDALEVPKAGAWSLSVWLKDAAGNQDRRLAAPPLTLRYDETSPDVTLNPLGADDPTLVTAKTADQGAGVTGGRDPHPKAGDGQLVVAAYHSGGCPAQRADRRHAALRRHV